MSSDGSAATYSVCRTASAGARREASQAGPSVEIDPDWYGDVSVEHAQRVLDRGYPATALCILKETHCGEPGVVETMRAAYQALGRTLHVDRADAWLRQWAEPTG